MRVFSISLLASMPLATSSHVLKRELTETVSINGLTVHKTVASGTTIQSVSFRLSGDAATDLPCEVDNPQFPPTKLSACAGSPYSFGLFPVNADDSEFRLGIRREVGGEFVELVGAGNVPVACSAGDEGSSDYVCNQTGTTTIFISSN
ncbi:hypothetical protein NM208_g1371 [Fusarium decemcellulare]|uniref:Uncharacterized protein n=2 Tax=Fusarium decemcellulare TaxID=57161 RepID=A0ACC1SSM1_9HYPO|nr:hypothetical protein NM208_g2476 [Fusarium decemcellulare]KAJ3547686.1 hypothetical protein NM208_g1371 [Fusarium decemcellulare]